MKLSFITKIGALLFLMFSVASANATEYYADANTTSSTQNGTMASPFKTIAQVNSKMSSFAPGDIIYFKRGGTFTGTLNVTRSGTAAAPITFSNYGTGALPIFTGAGRALVTIYGRNYIVLDGINFTDLNMDPDDHYAECNTEVGVEAEGSYLTVKNCNISLLGAGINLSGDYCTIDKNTIGNLRMIKNTPVSQNSDDDYGASPIIVSGAYSNITSNTFKECWAYSYDYGYDGGGVEFYGGGTNGNKIMYNTAINCNGFMEFGSGSGGTSNDNIIAYNLLINCGDLVYINSSGQYAITANNLQFYNNVLVETVMQFTGTQQMVIIGTNSSVVMKNNIFWLMTGVDVARSGIFSLAKNVHQDNIYRLGTGSVLNFTADASELVTTAPIFTSTSGHPSTWNYAPLAGSPAIDFGQNVSMSRDFAGVSVQGNATPNSGILEGNVTTPPAALAATSTAATINCNGGTTTVTVAATGGTGPYTGTGTFSKPAGTHTFTVTDATGATATTSITITQPLLPLTSVLTAGVILLNGGVTLITTVAAGGTLPYTYSLNNGNYQSSNIFTNVPAGTHTVTVKDAKNCTVNQVVTITQPGPTPQPPAATATAGSINCFGESATVTVSATGGTSPYTGTGTFTRAAGTHNFVVTDAAGLRDTVTVTLTQPTVLTASLNAGTIGTFGGTTSLTTTANGGTSPYTYKLNNGSYQSSNVFSNLVAGTYSVTVKDAKNCTTVKDITITQPSGPSLQATATAGTISCNGANTTVSVTATGGSAPYTGTGTFTRTAGTYNFVVTDATGVRDTATITINQPTALAASVSAGTIGTFGGTTSITATANGGTAPYTYRLNNGSYQASNVFSNVAAGTYTVTVRDANNCTTVKDITITQPSGPSLQATATAGTINCYGGSTTVNVTATGGTAPYIGTGTFTRTAGTYNFVVTDATGVRDTATISINQPTALAASVSAGTIGTFGGTTSVTATANGGTAPYTYRLNNGSYQASNVFSNVAAGTYTVTVRDANNCTTVRDITITQPAPGPSLEASATAGTISCYGGSTTVNVSASGGTAPYTGTGSFTRSAGTFTFTVTDAAGASDNVTITVTQPDALGLTLSAGTITVNGGTTTLTAVPSGGTNPFSYKLNNGDYQAAGTFTNVAAGTHTVTVRDAGGCTVTKNITITQPAPVPPLVAAATSGSISCNGGTTTVTVSATGGTAPYSGTGTFTRDAGTYTFTVTDANGLTDDVEIDIDEPAVLALTLTSGTITVNGGSTTLTATATGGTAPYSYRLNNGTYQSNNTFTVTAGSYTVTVRDAKGCTVSKNRTISQPGAPPPLVAAATAGTISCNGGTTTVTVTATGGSGSYTGTGTFTKGAGTHNFVVTDAAGVTDDVTITITQPTVINATVTTGTIAVNGGSTTATVNANGGSPAYTYSYDNGAYQASNTFSNVFAGAHSIRIKDSKGCITVKNFTVNQPAQIPALVVTATAGTISCNGGTTNVTVTATGGVAPYTGTGTFVKAAGTYTFSVTDANGTTSSTSVTVAQPTPLTIAVTTGTITVFGGSTTATASSNGGTAPYSFSYDNGTYQSSNIFNNVVAGAHTIRVKDARGCISSRTFTVTQPAAIPTLVAAATAGTITCSGGSTTVTVTATGGTAPYTGIGNFTRTAGTYTFTVTDANGLTSNVSVTVVQPAAINISFTNIPITDFGNTTTVTVNATGGNGGYTYRLDNGTYQSSNVFTEVGAGNHTLVVKDSKGCASSKNIVISQPEYIRPMSMTVSTSNPLCLEINNGALRVSVRGGKAPYVYSINGGAYGGSNSFNNLAAGIYTISVKDSTQKVVTAQATLGASKRSCRRFYLTALGNPVPSEFRVKIETENTEPVYMVVMNLNGQRVFEGRGKANDVNTFGKDFPQGVFILKVMQGGQTETLRLVKAH